MAAPDKFPGLTAAQARLDALVEADGGAGGTRLRQDFTPVKGVRLGAAVYEAISALEQGRVATANTLEMQERTDQGEDPGRFRTTVKGDQINGATATIKELTQGGSETTLTHRKTNGFGRRTMATFPQGEEVKVDSIQFPLIGTLRAKRVR
jgi:hypothetical protein